MQEKQIYSTSTIAEVTNGIILAKFEKTMMHDAGSYQSEAELENSMISNLVSQGYERLFAKTNIDFSDVEFEIDLLKTDEINLDYILALILSKAKESEDIENLKSEVRRVIRSSLGTRDKEELIIDFINSTRLSELKNTEDILESFYRESCCKGLCRLCRR